MPSKHSFFDILSSCLFSLMCSKVLNILSMFCDQTDHARKFLVFKCRKNALKSSNIVSIVWLGITGNSMRAGLICHLNGDGKMVKKIKLKTDEKQSE